MGCLDRPANVSLRTGEVAGASLACGATDIDVDCPVLAPKIVALAKECLGVSPRRMRPNSPRALMCQSASNFDPRSASNFDPLERRVRAVALAPSELVGVAETARARVGE